MLHTFTPYDLTHVIKYTSTRYAEDLLERSLKNSQNYEKVKKIEFCHLGKLKKMSLIIVSRSRRRVAVLVPHNFAPTPSFRTTHTFFIELGCERVYDIQRKLHVNITTATTMTCLVETTSTYENARSARTLTFTLQGCRKCSVPSRLTT